MALMSDRQGDAPPFGVPGMCSTEEGVDYRVHVIEGPEHAIDGGEIRTRGQMSS